MLRRTVHSTIGLLLLSITPVLTANAEGHGVGYRIVDNGYAVVLEFFYSGGEAMAYADVLIWSPDDDEVEHQNGRTDRNGRFAFAPTRHGVWRVEAKDGRGHKAAALCRVDPLQRGISTPPAEKENAFPGTLEVLLGISMIVNTTLGIILLRRTRFG